MSQPALRSFAAVALLAAGAAACAPLPPPGPYSPAPAAFSEADFAWSARRGQGAINGRVDFRRDGRLYDCTGSVALTPDTPYTRARFQSLYGSIDRAALPEAVVRARTVPDPNADYRSYVRAETCTDGRFAFSGLPDGSWFVIAPVSAGGEDRVVLMRRVATRGGRAVAVVL